MEAARDDLRESARARAAVYGLLSAIYRAEPTVDLIRAMKAPEFSQTLAELGFGLGEAFQEASPDSLAEDLWRHVVEQDRLGTGRQCLV